MIVARQLEVSVVKAKDLTAALEDNRAQVIGGDRARSSAEVAEGTHVAAKKVLQSLVEEELHVQRSRVGKGQNEGRQAALGAADGHPAEVRPIDFASFSGNASQHKEGLAR